MELIKMLNSIKNKLNKYSSIDIRENILETPIKMEIITKIETELGIVFPMNLREIYLKYSNGILFKWYDNGSNFGDNCKYGEFNLIPLKYVQNTFFDMQDMVEDAKHNQDELLENEGLLAMVKDWIYWVPILRFNNGDAFCIDKRDNAIYFLEHDVMDGGPNDHGLKIASSFDELINTWSMVYFVDIYYWSKGVNENGLDINKDIFINIK